MIIGSNTKINVFINMFNLEVLSEKLKYLIITVAGDEFDIMSVNLDIEEYSDNESTIESYNIDVRFDYQGAIDPEVYYFGRDIQKMSDKMRNIVITYVLNPKGKIVSGGENVTASDGFIWNSNFEADRKHEFAMSFKITPITED